MNALLMLQPAEKERQATGMPFFGAHQRIPLDTRSVKAFTAECADKCRRERREGVL